MECCLSTGAKYIAKENEDPSHWHIFSTYWNTGDHMNSQVCYTESWPSSWHSLCLWFMWLEIYGIAPNWKPMLSELQILSVCFNELNLFNKFLHTLFYQFHSSPSLDPFFPCQLPTFLPYMAAWCLFCFVIYWVYLVWSECPWIWNYPLEPVHNYIPQNTLRNHSSGTFGFVSICPQHRKIEEIGIAFWAPLFPVPQSDL